jgi:putative selenate reductase
VRKPTPGTRHIILKNVRGQRYLGAGLTTPGLIIEIEGIPGEDLAFCMGGPTVIVHGHAQNAVANTMDSGTVIVHGLGGDALAYSMRGGKLFIRDSVGYRVGIHMKEYGEQKPQVVVGGTSGDFLGEYMAGGTLVLLNRNNDSESVAGQADKTLATGIHGGEIFIFNYEVPRHLPGIGASLSTPSKQDMERIRPLVEEYCSHFGLVAAPLLERDVVKIAPAGSRPFSKFYYPTYPIHTGLKPEQAEMASPCEASCPVGIPTGRFLRHLRLGENKEALNLIDDYSPFRYSNCGFICPHLCMEGCSRGKVDFPVRTAELAFTYRSDKVEPLGETRREKIAVIGSGPSGLTAAYFLARQGYQITVYEADSHPGGKMYQVVSRRRLPLEDLQQDLQRIAALGITFNFNSVVDEKVFNSILDTSDHVIVATGAHRPFIPPVKGKEFIRGGLDFLKAFNSGREITVGPQAVLIGGGDVAIDGIEALIELQLKPENIVVIDIKTPAARLEDRRRWEAAGVRFLYPLFLQEATEEGVIVKDQAGRESFIPGDVLAFTSETPQMDFLPATVREQLDKRGFFTGENHSCLTADPHISIIGDASGLGLVANSIAKARNCAHELHARLQGLPYNPSPKKAISYQDLHLDWHVPLAGLDQTPVQDEFNRCLHCGVCVECDDCVNACPRQARTRTGNKFELDLNLCGGCGTCAAACKGGVIRMVPR